MAQDALPMGEVVGVVIGAIVLFTIISIVPIAITWFHRSRNATRIARSTHNPTTPMEEVTVERWLEQQVTRDNTQRFADETCPICLSALSSTPYLSSPRPVHLTSAAGSTAGSDGACSRREGIGEHENCIIVLNQCHHAFHLTCLTSWFEYRHYKCPLCQVAYSPVETV